MIPDVPVVQGVPVVPAVPDVIPVNVTPRTAIIFFVIGLISAYAEYITMCVYSDVC